MHAHVSSAATSDPIFLTSVIHGGTSLLSTQVMAQRTLMQSMNAALAAPGNDEDAFRALICATPGCGRAVHTEGRSRCCSGCSHGFHSRRCDTFFRQHQRISVSACIVLGCDRFAGQGHVSCCSTCKHSRGTMHSDHCNWRQTRLVRAGDSGTSNADVDAGDAGFPDSAHAASSMAPLGDNVLATTGGILEMEAMPSPPCTMTTSSAGGTMAASSGQQSMPAGGSSSVMIDLTELD